MRIGVMIGADRAALSLDDIVGLAQDVERAGLDNLWMANIRSHDAMTTLSVVARETARIGLGTAVTPTYPRHPVAMAQQALTTAAACRGRFTLGLGLSHQRVIENLYGLSYARPAAHMREYLQVLVPLLNGAVANHDGESFNVHDIAIEIPDATVPPVIIAALGPLMLDIAGAMSGGTNTWMVGPQTMAAHVIPRLQASARHANNPPPQIVGGFPIVVTDNPASVRAALGETLAIYGQLPSYRAMLDREGVATPAELALVGNESQLRERISVLAELGVTDFMAAIFTVETGAYARSLDFLAGIM